MNGVDGVAVIVVLVAFARLRRKGERFREPVVSASDAPKTLTFDACAARPIDF
jgi:hypothetical protein